MAEYWVDSVMAIVNERLERDKAALRNFAYRPILRRPNTTDLLREALAHPEEIPQGGREALGKFAKETYGDVARNLFPHLGLDEEGREGGI